MGPRLTPLHHPLRAVQDDSRPTAGQALRHRLGQRKQDVGARVGAQSSADELVQLRLKIHCGEQAGHLAGQRRERQDPGGRRDCQAQRVRGERAEGSRSSRPLLRWVRRWDLRVGFVVAGPLDPVDRGDQVAQRRLGGLDGDHHPAGGALTRAQATPGSRSSAPST